MNPIIKRINSRILGAAILALQISALPAMAQSFSQSKVVDGIQVDWGIFPGRYIARSRSPSEIKMHGGVPGGRYEYHLTVSLRNEKTWRQVGSARVVASMHELGISGPWKRLQVMRIGASVSYGNYFFMNAQEPVPYRLDLLIALPHRRPIAMEFTHYHD